MATYNSLGEIFQKLLLDKPIQRGVVRALNKSLSKNKTRFVRELKDTTGLKTKDLNKRILIKRANFKSLKGLIGLAGNIGVSIGEFAPRSKRVSVGNKSYYGVTAKIFGSREFIPGGFLRVAKSSGKEIVIARKATIIGGGYVNVPGYKYPTALLRTPLLSELANELKDKYINFALEDFDKIVNHEISYSLKQYIEKK